MKTSTRIGKVIALNSFLLLGLAAHAQKNGVTVQQKNNPTTGMEASVKWTAGKDQMPSNLQAFQENKGQFTNFTNNWTIKYGADYQGSYIMFTNHGLIYVMPELVPMTKADFEKEKNKSGKSEAKEEEVEKQGKKKIVYHQVTIEWEGANVNATIEGVDETSYKFGAIDPVNQGKSIDNIRGYKKLVYHNIYPGIDVEFTFHEGKGIEYTIRVKPGYDASVFKMKYTGQNSLLLDESGDIHMMTSMGDIIDHAPVAMQNGNKVESAFQKISKNEVSFKVSNVDSKSELVIDPWIVTPTSINYIPYDCGMDALDNVYVLGSGGTSGAITMYAQKFTTAGALAWTYTYTQYAAGFPGVQSDILVDPAGNTYVPSCYEYTNAFGQQYAMVKLTTGGTLGYFYNTYGSNNVFETWNVAYTCDSVFIQAGSPAILEQQMSLVNISNGNLLAYSVNTSIGEIYAGCLAPNGLYYGLSANPQFWSGTSVPGDQLVCYNASTIATSFAWSALLGYSYDDYHFKSPFGIGTNGIAASCTNLYTSDGYHLDQRSLTTGALTKRVIIPWGDTTVGGGFTIGIDSAATSGVAPDLGCGNVYVGSNREIVVYDQNLNKIDSLKGLPGSVFDVKYNNGMVAAVGANIITGNDFVTQFTAKTCPGAIIHTNATCGNNNGTATASPLFCGGPFTYVWSNGTTSAKDSNLGAGTYTVTIGTTGTCLTVVDTVTIGISGGMNIAFNSIGSGTCSSDITATVTGGTAPYTYLWSSGQTTSSINGVPSGTYTIYVTSFTGCKDSGVVKANVISGTVNTASYNEKCFAGNNGSAVINVTGTGPYTYKWIGSGNTTDSIGGLTTGTYTCIVTDNNGCKDTIPVSVAQPSPIRDSIVKSMNELCNGGSNGWAINGVTGGTGPYTYLWSNTQTSDTAKNLVIGSYTITVTDKNNCTATTNVTITQPAPLKDSIASVDVKCFGGNNGSATAIITGGTKPYTYSWTTGGTTSTVNVLAVGTYTVNIVDSNGCKTTGSISITQPTAINVTMVQTPSNCDSTDGSATATVSGGTSPYTYSWSPSGGTNTVAPNLKPGKYTVTVTDKNGCTDQDTITVKDNITSAVSVNSGKICAGDTIVLTAKGSSNYLWSTGATTSTISVEPGSTTSYTVTGSNGCVTKATAVVTVTAATVFACCDTSIALGGTAVLTATGAVSYVWSPSSNLGCYTCPTTTATPTVTTIYTVVGTDSNGCRAYAHDTVTIICMDYKVPNVFTPNGDNVNDQFIIKAYSMTTYSIEIYDRWGVLMYKSNTPDAPWDGTTTSGQQAPDGVYYYIIRSKCGGSDYDHHGFVQIIR